MATIDPQFSGVRDAFQKATSGFRAGGPGRSASTDNIASNSAPHDAIHDTVSLSHGGQKIVNLNRGQELAKQIKSAPVDQDFAENLRKSSQDIFRITQLFTQTVKSAFGWMR